MAIIRSLMGLVIISLFCLIVYYQYTQKHMAYCTASDLKLYPVAIAYPGMSQTHTAYALINHSNRSCRIARTPSFEQTATSTSPDNIILKPITSTKHLTWKKIPWFSVHANSACSSILSTLPKTIPIYFSHGLKLPLPALGYPCEPHIGKPLSIGLTQWTQAKQCRHSNKQHLMSAHVFLSDNLPINLGETLVCD
ncbi:MAG: hypothetical protein CMF55_01285 [Legionellales bacterium]|mgnify:CR=1 FL=1|nr:hypothetical protein [Legionellales bacterium]HAG62149.1 hypothetical protein [Coxiellaceae bacterium]